MKGSAGILALFSLKKVDTIRAGCEQRRTEKIDNDRMDALLTHDCDDSTEDKLRVKQQPPHLLFASSLLLGGLVDERLVDVGNDTTTCDGGLDEGIELLVTTDGELEMTRSDTLDFQVLGCVSSELENLGGQVLHDGRGVDSCGRSDALLLGNTLLQVSVDTSDRELFMRSDDGEISAFVFMLEICCGGDEKTDYDDRNMFAYLKSCS